jgi:hypothetical protein
MSTPVGVDVSHTAAGQASATGRLEKVVVDVSGELIVDSEADLRMSMGRQYHFEAMFPWGSYRTLPA